MRLLPTALGGTLVVIAAVAGGAETPGVGDLIANVPLLSADNPSLHHFRATIEVGNPENPEFFGEILWRRDHDPSVLIAAGAERCPFVFVADRQALLIDAIHPAAMLFSDHLLGCEIRRSDTGTSLQLAFGKKGKEGEPDPKIHIDLPSMFSTALDTGSVSLEPDGRWRLVWRAPRRPEERSTQVDSYAIFSPSDGFPIESMGLFGFEREMATSTEAGSIQEEQRSTAVPGPQTAIVLRSLVINEVDDAKWPRFPDSKDLPQALTKHDYRGSAAEQQEDGPEADGLVEELVQLTAHFYRTLQGRCALEYPQLRDNSLFRDVDWREARGNSVTLSDELRPLLTAPQAKSSTQP